MYKEKTPILGALPNYEMDILSYGTNLSFSIAILNHF